MSKAQKVLDYKTYNSIGHLPGSRVGPSDSTIDEKTASHMTREIPNQQSLIIVQEKIDGSNVCVVRHENKIRTLSRNGFDCKESNQEQHRMFDTWVANRIQQFEFLLPNEGDRVVGEWLALAHGTIYESINLNNVFTAFDLFLNKEQVNFHSFLRECSRAQINTPLILHMGGACSIKRALKKLSEISSNKDAEGLIYRWEEDGKPKNIAKYVKADKIDGKYLAQGSEYIWNFKG